MLISSKLTPSASCPTLFAIHTDLWKPRLQDGPLQHLWDLAKLIWTKY